MAHLHEDSDTYYLDQLCLIALSAAFGGVCLTLYFVNTKMLELMLGKQFHDFVGISGVVLVGLAAVRGVILWRQVGKLKSAAHTHSHEHAHHDCCGHEHAHAVAHSEPHTHSHGGVVHSHGPSPALAADHTHAHDHEHNHGHEHDHDHADHEQGWAPWRYVVLLLPVFLFLLGLPNRPPKARATNLVDINPTETIAGYSALVSQAYEPTQSIVLSVSMFSTGTAKGVHFRTLQDAAFKSPELEGTWVIVKGQFAPSRRSDRVFSLARFKMQCCASDAVQLNVPVSCRESLLPLPVRPGDWIEVTGRVEFHASDRGSKMTVLKVPSLKQIRPSAPDPDPWIN